MPDIKTEREKINQIDMQLAELFEQRMEAAKNIALYKKQNGLPVFDESREKEICEKELNYINKDEYKQYYLEFIQNLMNISKKYQALLIK